MKQYHIVYRLKYKNGTLSGKNAATIEAKCLNEAKEIVATKNKHDVVDSIVIEYAGLL